MRRVLAALAVACAFSLPARSEPAIQIYGRVVAADTGDPLVHARVVIFNDALPLSPIFSDAQGRFSSVPLPQGRYRLTVTKAGYALTSVARLDSLSPDDVEVRLPRSSAIAGRVLDEFGEPAPGVSMRLLTRSPDRTKVGVQVKATSTDDLGEYRFGGLAAGAYVVSATMRQVVANDVNESVNYYPGVAAIANALDIDLHPGDERLGIDFSSLRTPSNEIAITAQTPQRANGGVGPNGPSVTPPNGQSVTPPTVVATSVIRGRVTRADGLPIARATVSTQVQQTGPGRQANINGARSAQTDEDGNYELAELPAGQYRVSAAKPGYIAVRYGQREDADQGAVVDVGDAQARTRIDIVLPRNSNITGRVVDEYGDPVENVAVTLSQIRYQGGRRRLVTVSAMSGRTTDDLGRYRVYAVPPGDYIVSASVGQVVAFQPATGVSGYATTYYPSTSNPGEAQFVSVPRAQDVTAIDFVLVPTPTAMISGKKLGADGEPFGGSLTLAPSQRSGTLVTPPTGARIYDDGRFEFPNVAPGDYVIQADQGKPSRDREGQFAAAFVSVNGENVPDVLLESAPGSTISGQVTFEGDGPSVQSLTITTSRADFDRTPNGTAQGEVGPDLRFNMTGIRGPRRITLARAPAGWMLKSVTAKGIDVTDAVLPFGTADQSLTDVQVVVTSHITELSGSVVDARGDQATSYTLLVFPVDRDRWYPGSRYFRRAGSGAGGNFSLRGLPPSDYYVAPMSGWKVLKDGDDAWQDPEFLESISLRAARATLTDGQRLTISSKLITP
ncbi:MAG TPA: carboxypeptidase-like regulatory domain-containing protein [Vicinamibacterales bacterium]|nr:carboxypeptidase-like regulatory domain-containing protein [Vicinamibacterales bacterium]